ncbi:hypothetical protein M8J76_007142 [Diaphorina citri]|nr:hypothetical protein M8J76_007142 [Diaphorina citri]
MSRGAQARYPQTRPGPPPPTRARAARRPDSQGGGGRNLHSTPHTPPPVQAPSPPSTMRARSVRVSHPSPALSLACLGFDGRAPGT